MKNVIRDLQETWNKRVGRDGLVFRYEKGVRVGGECPHYLKVDVNPRPTRDEGRELYSVDFITGEFKCYVPGDSDGKKILKLCYKTLNDFSEGDFETDCEIPVEDRYYEDGTGDYTFEFVIKCNVEIGMDGLPVMIGMPNRYHFETLWERLINIVMSY